MADYKFVDHWVIRAPMESVFAHISDARTYSRWWRDYDRVTILNDVPFPYVGGRAEFIVRSPFGYRLRLDVTVIAADPPRSITTQTRGELEGVGLWELREADGATHVTFTWTVRSVHPLLNRLERVAKPLFALSHAIISRRGARGLRRLLETTADRRPRTTADHELLPH